MILYEGKSQLDGSPIVAIATFGSNNRKTGSMIQTWILRSDVDPVTAVKEGSDRSICGTCPFRGSFATRTCYVNVGQAPQAVYRAYKRGSYPRLSDNPDKGIARFRGKYVRLGAYGDPVAVPVNVWARILRVAKGWTGYTHSWALDIADPYRHLCMASTETLSTYRSAVSKGWRSFRVVSSDRNLRPNEILCPSDRGIQCVDCRLCNGNPTSRRAGYRRVKDIAIVVHGTGSRNFEPATAKVERQRFTVQPLADIDYLRSIGQG